MSPPPLLNTWPPSSWRLLWKLGTASSENICFPRRRGPPRTPTSQPAPTASRAEPFLCPHRLTPTFITPPPLPPQQRAPRAMGWRPGPLHHLSPPVRMYYHASVVTLLLRGLLLSCYPLITACREEGGGQDETEERRGGKGGEEASVLLPQSGDCWNIDRSICHGLLSHTHLLSRGPTVFLTLSLALSLSLYLAECVKLSDASFGNPHP